MTMRRIFLLLLTFGLPLSAHADLIDMNDGTVFDTNTQLSWLKDAGMGGLLTWADAIDWANTLSFAGFDDWRLPITFQLDSSCSDQASAEILRPAYSFGYNCTGSDLGNLFYTELGNLASYPPTNTGPFVNVEPFYYWSATEYFIPGNAWNFGFGVNGYQGSYDTSLGNYAWAVRFGERSVLNPVPEPSTIALLSLGLAAVALVKRKQKG